MKIGTRLKQVESRLCIFPTQIICADKKEQRDVVEIVTTSMTKNPQLQGILVALSLTTWLTGVIGRTGGMCKQHFTRSEQRKACLDLLEAIAGTTRPR